MFCNKCGNKLPDGTKFCPRCGTKVGGDSSVKIKISKVIDLSEDNKRKLIMGVVGIILFLLIVLIFRGCSREASSKVNLTYSYNEDGTATIVKSEESTTTVKIPEKVKSEGKTYRVTNIGEGAFSGCDSLTSVEIPEGVLGIGTNAFSGCSSLKSIEIPDSVMNIGANAFSDCNELTSIRIPSKVTCIEAYVFKNCTNLVKVEIVDGLSSIGEGAFSGCSSLSDIEIPSNLTSIGKNAFYSCNSLKKVELSYDVTNIGENAFRDCDGITKVEIKGSGKATSIGAYAFYDCDNLVEVEIDETLTGNMAYYNNFAENVNIFTRGGIKIETYAFASCDSLSSVRLRYVTYIGVQAFGECNSLKTVEMSESDAQIITDGFDARLVMVD